MREPLTAQETADKLGYHIRHLYRLLRNGTIEAKHFNHVWMIEPQEVERIKALQGPGGRLPRTAPEQVK